MARFFNLPSSEVAILSDWEIPADEIPVVLFMARRSGVSPEALVALREAQQSWVTLATRYRVGPFALYVPVPDDASAGALEVAYEAYRTVPVAQWGSIQLTDADVVGLVNVRLISQTLGIPAEQRSGSHRLRRLLRRLVRSPQALSSPPCMPRAELRSPGDLP